MGMNLLAIAAIDLVVAMFAKTNLLLYRFHMRMDFTIGSFLHFFHTSPTINLLLLILITLVLIGSDWKNSKLQEILSHRNAAVIIALLMLIASVYEDLDPTNVRNIDV
jgi:hypothetical protein